jgi:hypothetical protein
MSLAVAMAGSPQIVATNGLAEEASRQPRGTREVMQLLKYMQRMCPDATL